MVVVRGKKKGKGFLVGLAVLGGLVLTLGVLALVFKDKIRAGYQTAVTGKVPDEPIVASSAGSGKGTKIVPANAKYPRRALIISVHNYLYANPLVDVEGELNVRSLISSLNVDLHIPLEQIVLLSDGTRKSGTAAS